MTLISTYGQYLRSRSKRRQGVKARQGARNIQQEKINKRLCSYPVDTTKVLSAPSVHIVFYVLTHSLVVTIVTRHLMIIVIEFCICGPRRIHISRTTAEVSAGILYGKDEIS